MDNFLEIFKSINSLNNNTSTQEISKELKEEYPYGEFPLRYTKSGQESIRKQSENRFLDTNNTVKTQSSNSFDSSITSILPLLEIFSGKKKQPQDLMQIFGKLLFKDNPELQKIFQLIPKMQTQETKNSEVFPDTNKVKINNLERID